MTIYMINLPRRFQALKSTQNTSNFHCEHHLCLHQIEKKIQKNNNKNNKNRAEEEEKSGG